MTATVESPTASPPPDAAWDTWFDAEALGLCRPADGSASAPVLIRVARPGERMVPFGGREPVRLAKLLAAAGVPRHARARWLVVARDGGPGGDEALWLLGVRRCAVAPITPLTRLVLHLQGTRAQPPGPEAS